MNDRPRHPSNEGRLSLRTVLYEPGVEQTRHHHETTTLTLLLRGSLEERVGSAHEEAGPLSVVFKPAGTEHANRIGPRGASTVQIRLDPGFEPVPGADGPEGWGWSHGGAAARRFLSLFAAWRACDPAAVEAEAAILDVLAGFEGSEPASSGPPPAWLEAVVEEVDDTFRSPRSVRDMAAGAGVHPVSLARAHRRHFGASITDRLRERRVRYAADLLGNDDESLSSVAFAAGFSDQSHLTRVFGAETGLTPAVYRSLASG